MGLANKKSASDLVDMGDCRDINTHGLADIEFLPGDTIRLICYVEEDKGRRRTVIAKCVWPVERLLEAAEQVERVLAARGYVRKPRPLTN